MQALKDLFAHKQHCYKNWQLPKLWGRWTRWSLQESLGRRHYQAVNVEPQNVAAGDAYEKLLHLCYCCCWSAAKGLVMGFGGPCCSSVSAARMEDSEHKPEPAITAVLMTTSPHTSL